MEHKKILIVDDEEEICLFMKEKLDREYRVNIAHTGEKGMEWITREPFDLYIFDLKLSGRVTGIDMIRHVKQLYPNATIVAMTGYTDLKLKEEALQAGVTEYALKPSQIQPDEIHARVRRLLEALEKNSQKTI